jgi:hypothetical protein
MSKEIMKYILAWVIMIGFFCELGYLLHLVHSGNQIADSSGSVFMLMGGLNGMATMVAMYFFGSTQGSATKTAAMVEMAKTGDFSKPPCPPEADKKNVQPAK